MITGTLPTMSREEGKAIIKYNFGKTTTSISKKSDYLVAREKAVSKLEKAESLDIQVIVERGLLKL